MNRAATRILLLALAIFLLSIPSSFGREGAAAELVLRNGFIYTVDAGRTVAQALAVRGGRIVFAGSDGGAAGFIGEGTEVIDLGGRLVLPGFIDSHCHAAYGAAHELFDIMFTGMNSVEEYRQAIRDFAAKHPDAKFVKGRGWKNTLFGKTGPDKGIIDEIIPGVPVALDDEGGHATWVNSLTLRLAGITKQTENPRGGVIERDPATGEATGTLREGAAGLVSSLFPDYTTEQLMEAIESYQRMAASFGITTAHDATVDVGGSDFNAYKNLERTNRLAMRFRASLWVDQNKGLEQVPGLVAERAKNSGPLFQANGAKVYIDGVIEGSTGYLLKPYRHIPHYRGVPRWEAEPLNAMCAELDRNGFQVHVHAIGDAATAMVLDAFAYARARNGPRDARNLVTHLQLVAPRDIRRFRELGVVAVPQPYWFMKDDYYYNIQVPYLGQKRADAEYPMASFIRNGVVAASSSDYAVTIPCNPLRAIQIGITRSVPGVTDPKEVLWPAERVTLEQMIASFTIHGAYANFLEDTTGSLEVGKSADFIVLDRNLFRIPAEEIGRAKVILTYFAGRRIFSACRLEGRIVPARAGLPGAAVGSLPAGEGQAAEAGDQGQLFSAYLFDRTPLGERWAGLRPEAEALFPALKLKAVPDLHVTVVYIGEDWDAEKLSRLRQAVTLPVSEPVSLAPAIAYFGRSDRVIAVELKGLPEELSRRVAGIKTSLSAAGMKKPEAYDGSFRPHVTLAEARSIPPTPEEARQLEAFRLWVSQRLELPTLKVALDPAMSIRWLLAAAPRPTPVPEYIAVEDFLSAE